MRSWDEFEFLDGALEGLRLLAARDVPVVVVTNQRGIARGIMTEEDLAEIHARMLEYVVAAGGRVDAVYHCPHEGGCRCRKPGPGLFELAAGELDLRLSETAVIGDRLSDVQAAQAIGARAVLVPSDVDEVEARVLAEHVAVDLADAVAWLFSEPRTAVS